MIQQLIRIGFAALILTFTLSASGQTYENIQFPESEINTSEAAGQAQTARQEIADRRAGLTIAKEERRTQGMRNFETESRAFKKREHPEAKQVDRTSPKSVLPVQQ